MEEKKLNFAEIQQQNEEKLNLFNFIILVPNPLSKSVTLRIDGDTTEIWMDTDRFLEIIEATCGFAERNRLEVTCHEYGTPCIYDREKRMLKQLAELPPGRDLQVTADYHKKYESANQSLADSNNLFSATQPLYEQLKSFGMPSFKKENKTTDQNFGFKN